jgi:hypothetical protein
LSFKRELCTLVPDNAIIHFPVHNINSDRLFLTWPEPQHIVLDRSYYFYWPCPFYMRKLNGIHANVSLISVRRILCVQFRDIFHHLKKAVLLPHPLLYKKIE